MKKIIMLGLLLLCCYFLFTANICASTVETGKTQLSSEELQYFQENNTLRVSILTDWKPFSFRDEKGKDNGVPTLILGKLVEASGVTLEVVFAKNYEESMEQLRTGEADVCGMFMQYPAELENTLGKDSTQLIPYLTSQMVLISHKNTNLGSLPSVTLADITARDLFTYNSAVQTVTYESPVDCFNAIRSGQADITACDFFTSTILMQQYNSRDLISRPTTITMEVGFGLSPEADEQLVSSLQKTIESITRNETNEVLVKNGSVAKEDIFQFVYHYPFEIICFSLAIMFIIMLSIYVYAKLRLRQHQSLQGYEQSYRLLADTLGEGGVEYDYISDRFTVFGEKSNLDIPQVVDDFHEKLQSRDIRLALTVEEFDTILKEGAEERSFSADFKCGIKSGGWIWYRLIYTVICTTESHRRPIRLVGCFVNIDAERQEMEQLMHLSTKDQLTGLYNRFSAEEQIRKKILEEDSCAGILVMIDIDYFKAFNDEIGHSCGDDVLRNLGRFVRENTLPEDILCRWGGDEFLFFFGGRYNTIEEVYERFERLCKYMKNYTYQGISHPVTLSAGAAKKYLGCTFEELFEQADQALYLAKERGRSQLCIADGVERDVN